MFDLIMSVIILIGIGVFWLYMRHPFRRGPALSEEDLELLIKDRKRAVAEQRRKIQKASTLNDLIELRDDGVNFLDDCPPKFQKKFKAIVFKCVEQETHRFGIDERPPANIHEFLVQKAVEDLSNFEWITGYELYINYVDRIAYEDHGICHDEQIPGWWSYMESCVG